ncbi:MAG TPA: hypothetical protein VFL86_01950 [Burkholderiaceae bacterium]|nr:hypothetical protein [Burkholderiaceae bacterium]
MQSRLLNSSIESTLTLVVSGLCVALIAAGTLSMARSADTAVAVAALEPVVITGTHAAADAARQDF